MTVVPLWVLPAFLLVLITAPAWLRLSNEITGRLVGRVVVICPHCGMPGVVRSSNPRVIR